LEFQRRGAPHFHLFIAPWTFIPHTLAATAWWSATGGVASIAAGTRTERLRGSLTSGDACPLRRGTIAYAMKYARKQEQKAAPDGLGPGRWWGVMGCRAVHPPRVEFSGADRCELASPRPSGSAREKLANIAERLNGAGVRTFTDHGVVWSHLGRHEEILNDVQSELESWRAVQNRL
jgi:hypothetical protein